MVKGSGSGWFRNKKGKKLFCWYNDAGEERSKVIGNGSITDAEGWIAVADLKLYQCVGKPDPKNACFGEVLRTGRTTEKPKRERRRTSAANRQTSAMLEITCRIGPAK